MHDHIAHFINGQWQLGEDVQVVGVSAWDWWQWGLFALGCLASLALLAVLLSSMFHVNREYERSIILRLGSFRRVAGRGFFFTYPFIDTVLDTVEILTQMTLPVVEQALTRDTVAVTVTTVVFWRIFDPEKAVLAVRNYHDAVLQTAQAAVRDAIGTHSLASLLSDATSMDAHIMAVMDARTTPWGIQIESVDIKDVRIPDDLQDAMSRQAQATQEGLARERLAQSEKTVALLTVEAADIYARSPSALTLRGMGLVYEMGQNSNTIVIPTDMASCMAGAMAISARTP